MEIVTQYPIKIEHWIHMPIKEFNGLISDSGYNYIFGITPEDKEDSECCYFNIWIEKKMINETTKKVVFYAKTYSGFKVRNRFKTPTSQFFFELVQRATYEFAFQFHQRTSKTNLSHHKIKKPQFLIIRDDLEKTINYWDENYRNSALRPAPNWQIKFRDLPEIPQHKKWRKNSYSTLEQDISNKLQNRQPITEEEERIFLELTTFYNELDKKLIALDYQSFSTDDFENFKNYIFYAFNYNIVIANELTVFKTYRLVVNEWVSGKNESLTNVSFLKYPSLEIVKKTNKYNRANTPNTTIFYSAENIDTTLKEIRPPLGKLVTVGVWAPVNVNKKLISFPISNSETAMSINEGVKKATKAFDEQEKYNSPLFMNFMRFYLKILGREFAKRTSHHYEFLISALFSEKVFSLHNELNDDFRFDCIIFPSVGNDYICDNLGILPNVIDNGFKLIEALEFEVEEAYYDTIYSLRHPEEISLAKIRNFRRTGKIEANGEIRW